MRGTLLIVAALTLSLLYSGVALAGAPSNDNVANALDVAKLPFSHTVDITQATQEPDDLHCGTIPGGNTVWYKITPARDLTIGFHTGTEVEELSLSIFAGSPASLIMLYCSYSPYNSLEAAAGTTYYLQMATCCGSPGGPVTITIQDVPDLSVDLRIERRGLVGEAGAAKVSGKVRCNRSTPPGSGLTVQGTLTQGRARGWLVPVHFADGCSAKWTSWSTTVQLFSGDGFSAGKATLNATAFACDEFDTCANPVTEMGEARLR